MSCHRHLSEALPVEEEPEYYIIFLVDAPKLDYSDSERFLGSMAKRANRSISGVRGQGFGHAWIYLKGDESIEGGHSGEWGSLAARYFDGVMNYIEYGYPNPTEEEKRETRFEPNPIKYLFYPLFDGCFEKGSGGHTPSFAAKRVLSRQEYLLIRDFISPHHYYYAEYSLLDRQCCSFLVQIAHLLGLDLNCQMTFDLKPELYFQGRLLRLYQDHIYRQIAFFSPDLLEQKLKERASEGQLQPCLNWYLKKRKKCPLK
ncbi:MAG: hypothetical protein K0S07_1492 [Chlamydiales bacterium]|jgi:hypothetical protein|nr:hypothetical protein [Chlamydiales bacterium]